MSLASFFSDSVARAKVEDSPAASLFFPPYMSLELNSSSILGEVGVTSKLVQHFFWKQRSVLILTRASSMGICTLFLSLVLVTVTVEKILSTRAFERGTERQAKAYLARLAKASLPVAFLNFFTQSQNSTVSWGIGHREIEDDCLNKKQICFADDPKDSAKTA